MNIEAKRTLREIHTLQRFDEYLRIARAELASDSRDDRLRAFMDVIEQLLREERKKLDS